MKALSKEQYNKLQDCEVLQDDYLTWLPAKFYSRGLGQVNYALEMKDGSIVIAHKGCSCVKVNGIELKYIPHYSFTNPKNPFKTE
jgi:hypothetical protein